MLICMICIGEGNDMNGFAGLSDFVKFRIAEDVCRGMAYIHSRCLHYHVVLNCSVDCEYIHSILWIDHYAIIVLRKYIPQM
jgi:hypothetical protein